MVRCRGVVLVCPLLWVGPSPAVVGLSLSAVGSPTTSVGGLTTTIVSLYLMWRWVPNVPNLLFVISKRPCAGCCWGIGVVASKTTIEGP